MPEQLLVVAAGAAVGVADVAHVVVRCTVREQVQPLVENRVDVELSEREESKATAEVDGGDGDVGDGASSAVDGSAESRIFWKRAEANSSGQNRNRHRSVAAD